MIIRAIGAFYGQSGRISGAERGAELLYDYAAQCHHVIAKGDTISLGKLSIRTHIGEVLYIADYLERAVAKALRHGEFPVIFGGDHSIAIGTIAGALSVNPQRLGVIYIDAHADMNTFETSPTKNIHGMSLAVCMGLGEEHLVKLVPNKLPSSHLMQMGGRSIDTGELKLIQSNNIELLSTEDLIKLREQDVADRLKLFIEKNRLNQLHVSFDIDVIDPKYAPATGVPEQNGLSLEQVKRLLALVFKTRLVKSMDIVEFNPLLDRDGMTLDLCKNLVDYIVRDMLRLPDPQKCS